MVVWGAAEIHGKLFHPTWTRVAIPIYEGDNLVYLQESVNWEVGQEIVVITTGNIHVFCLTLFLFLLHILITHECRSSAD